MLKIRIKISIKRTHSRLSPLTAHLHLQLLHTILQKINHPASLMLLLLQMVNWTPRNSKIGLQHFY